MYNILLTEGRIEDGYAYMRRLVGDENWPDTKPGFLGIGAGTNVEGVVDHFVREDPSGNHKYLMWLVKTFVNDSGFSPAMMTDLVKKFHTNIDRIENKDINSYNYDELKKVVEEAESRVTRSQKEKEAKKGAVKLYEDGRWLLVKPETLEASCYYGAGTQWCTTSRNDGHFASYTKQGPLYYIIDKSRELGRFYKIALHKNWEGHEEMYDEEDNRLDRDIMDAVSTILPHKLMGAIHNDWEDSEPKIERRSLSEFQDMLKEFMQTRSAAKNFSTISTESGKWSLEISDNGIWYWTSLENPEVEFQATPFLDNQLEIPFYTDDVPGMEEGLTFGEDYLERPAVSLNDYLDDNPTGRHHDYQVRMFLYQIYNPLLKKVFNDERVKEVIGKNFSTWSPGSWVSSYTFKYPPRPGSMTQRFVDYVKKNPGKTANQFYQDVLGYPRPRGHNNMFFAAIKDAGIVELNRRGRQFVYTLGPNHEKWKAGLLRKV